MTSAAATSDFGTTEAFAKERPEKWREPAEFGHSHRYWSCDRMVRDIRQGGSVMSNEVAIKATVSGDDQRVGLRALIMKQAIRYNLAGSAVNEPNQIVNFTLQGNEQRINSAVEIIEAGTKKSSGIAVTTTPSTVVTTLNAFTIVDWTSLSRSITNKYTLVFDLREGDTEISRDEAKEAWHQILEKTLNPDDLEKLHPDD
jgi:acylphosphatase